MMVETNWTLAFAAAAKFQENGAKSFNDEDDTKREPSTNTSSKSDLKILNTFDHSGGFCQPIALSEFVQELLTNNDPPTSNERTIKQKNKKRKMKDIDSSTPLQHTIDTTDGQHPTKIVDTLNPGHPCPFKDSCLRKHSITEINPQKLYRDFSFKGLTVKQRNAIVEQYSAELETKESEEKKTD